MFRGTDDAAVSRSPRSKGKDQAFDLIKAIHAAEESFHTDEYPAHRFQVGLDSTRPSIENSPSQIGYT